MVITRKLINDIYCIDIPDEGVNKTKDEINLDFNKLDSFSMMKYTMLSELCLYHFNLINDILKFIENNQVNFNYEFLETNHYEADINLVTSFIVKGKSNNIQKLSKAISRLIDNKKKNYKKEV